MRRAFCHRTNHTESIAGSVRDVLLFVALDRSDDAMNRSRQLCLRLDREIAIGHDAAVASQIPGDYPATCGVRPGCMNHGRVRVSKPSWD